MAVVLNKFEDMNYAEIAEVMGLTTKAVKSLLSRARANLREALQGYIYMDAEPPGSSRRSISSISSRGPKPSATFTARTSTSSRGWDPGHSQVPVPSSGLRSRRLSPSPSGPPHRRCRCRSRPARSARDASLAPPRLPGGFPLHRGSGVLACVGVGLLRRAGLRSYMYPAAAALRSG